MLHEIALLAQSRANMSSSKYPGKPCPLLIGTALGLGVEPLDVCWDGYTNGPGNATQQGVP